MSSKKTSQKNGREAGARITNEPLFCIEITKHKHLRNFQCLCEDITQREGFINFSRNIIG